MTSRFSESVHPQSLQGYGETADLYDRVRAHYPNEAISLIRSAIPVKANIHIVEIGAGTGIFTRDLLGHPVWSDCVSEVIAVEPNSEMRKVFENKTEHPGTKLTAIDGTFEHTNVGDGWADIIIMATSYHWCQDYESAVREFVRILKPQGTIAMIWNPHDSYRVQWVKKVDDIREAAAQKKDGSFHTRKVWGRTFDLSLYKEHFDPPRRSDLPFHETVTADIAVQRFLTWSGIAVMPPDEKEEAVSAVRRIIEEAGEEEKDGFMWISKAHGTFQFPYIAHIEICQRKGII